MIATADVTSRLIDFVTETLLLVPLVLRGSSGSPWFFWFSVVLLVLLVLRGSSGSPWFCGSSGSRGSSASPWFFWFSVVLVVLHGSPWFSGSSGWFSCVTSSQISSDWHNMWRDGMRVKSERMDERDTKN